MTKNKNQSAFMKNKEYVDDIIRKIKTTGCRFDNRTKFSLQVAIYVLTNINNYTIKDYRIWEDSDGKVNTLVFFKNIWLYGIHIIIYPRGKTKIEIQRVGFVNHIVRVIRIRIEHLLPT